MQSRFGLYLIFKWLLVCVVFVLTLRNRVITFDTLWMEQYLHVAIHNRVKFGQDLSKHSLFTILYFLYFFAYVTENKACT